MTPAASDSAAEAAVCTILFSRMFDSWKSRNTAIEMTAAGMDAETVMPTFSPRYAFAPARISARTNPSTTALNVISGREVVAGMYGAGAAPSVAFDSDMNYHGVREKETYFATIILRETERMGVCRRMK